MGSFSWILPRATEHAAKESPPPPVLKTPSTTRNPSNTAILKYGLTAPPQHAGDAERGESKTLYASTSPTQTRNEQCVRQTTPVPRCDMLRPQGLAVCGQLRPEWFLAQW
jgi:hypothetical protein